MPRKLRSGDWVEYRTTQPMDDVKGMNGTIGLIIGGPYECELGTTREPTFEVRWLTPAPDNYYDKCRYSRKDTTHACALHLILGTDLDVIESQS